MPPIFIPEALDLPDRPELSSFPTEIQFGDTGPDKSGDSRLSVYIPVVESYKMNQLDPLFKRLRYVNRLGAEKRDYIDIGIGYDPAGAFYEANRYVRWEFHSRVFGADWESFFSNLTGQGIIDGEKFEIQKLTEQTSGGVH